MKASDKCEVCGGAIDRSKYPRRMTCSNACRIRGIRDSEKPTWRPIKCSMCGETFYIDKTQSACLAYCSDDCRAKVKKVYQEQAKLKARQKAMDKAKLVHSYSCSYCGKGFSTSTKTNRKYCSKNCLNNAHRKYLRACEECGKDFKSTVPDARFCSNACLSVYANRVKSAKDAQRRKEREAVKAEKIKQERLLIAKGLRMWRKGMSAREVAVALGKPESTGSHLLLKSKQYSKITKKRKEQSKWRKCEIGSNNRSSLYSSEREFQIYALCKMRDAFDLVQCEVGLKLSRRRIDLLVEHGGHRFGVELKNSCRTARLDQLLGQVLVKSLDLDCIPVCAIPSDLAFDSKISRAMKHYGIIHGNIDDVIEQMMQVCSSVCQGGLNDS